MESAFSWAVLALLASALFWFLPYIGGGVRSLENAVRDNTKQIANLTVQVGLLANEVEGHGARLTSRGNEQVNEERMSDSELDSVVGGVGDEVIDEALAEADENPLLGPTSRRRNH